DVDRIYEFRIKETDFSSRGRYSDVITVNARELILEKSPVSDMKPKSFALAQNYPNPFNPQTQIRISLLEPARINLSIYNLTGQKIRSLYEGNKDTGVYTFSWHGVDDDHMDVPSGEYICVLKAENAFIQARKMVFLK
ncbi:MAG: FlgD immunoglobulin-like domain containing protein, partial [candidate division KSB1 bacterium]|nr:FlgD immunoglobulin-like domain containing protein [candidate division KSB1 bacterium]